MGGHEGGHGADTPGATGRGSHPAAEQATKIVARGLADGRRDRRSRGYVPSARGGMERVRRRLRRAATTAEPTLRMITSRGSRCPAWLAGRAGASAGGCLPVGCRAGAYVPG